MLCFPLILTPYISRTIGADGIGFYSYNYSIAHCFVIFAMQGLSNYGTRTISIARSDGKNALSLAFWEVYCVQFFCASGVTALYLFYAFFISKSSFVSVVFLLYVISAFFDITWFFFGIEEFKGVLLRNVFVKIFTTLLLFVIVKKPQDVVLYSIIMLLGILLPHLFLWLNLKKHLFYKKISVRSAFRKHFYGNAKLFIPVLAISVYKYMDKIMLGQFSSTVELGYYENVERLVNIPVAFATSMGTVMLSKMSHIYNSEEHNIANNYIKNSVVFTVWISSAMVFGIFAILDQFVPLFFGPGFERCIDLAYWMLPTTLFLGISNVVRTQHLIPLHKDKIYIISVCIGAAINLFANILLIPRYGAIGAAIGTFLAELSVFLYQYLMVRRSIKVSFSFAFSLGFILIGTFMFLAVRPIEVMPYSPPLTLIIKIITGVLLYVLLSLIYLLLFKKFRKTAKEFLLGMRRNNDSNR